MNDPSQNPKRPSKGLEPVFGFPDELDETGEFSDDTLPSEAEAPVVPSSEFSLPGYRILGVLGQGGMGIIYRAFDEELNREVAIKTLTTAAYSSSDMRERFTREVQALAKLAHDHIARVYQTGMAEGRPYFVMELVDGPNLAEKINAKPLDPKESARILFDVCEAVEESHRQGIIHRDLKPSNVLLTEKGEVKVTDFGLARLRGDTSTVTRTGEVMGTPSYMAPEQASGVVKQMSARTDVYGIGAMLFEMLTGRPVFQAPEPAQILLMVLQTEPVAPRQLQPGIPADLETICLRCLEKSPARRYASAREVAEELHRFLIGEPIHARPVGQTERMWKWMRRHPWQSIAASMLLLGVVLTIAAFAWHNQQLSRELKRTRRVVDEGRVFSKWLLNDYVPEMESPRGITEKRADLVGRIANFLNAIGAETRSYGESDRELASSYEIVAGLLGDPFSMSLGKTEESEATLRRALTIRERLADKYPGREELAVEQDRTRLILATFLLGQLRFDESTELVEQVRADFEKRTPDVESATFSAEELNVYKSFVSLEGDLAVERGDYQAALDSYRVAQDALNKHGKILSAQGQMTAFVVSQERIADIHQRRGEYELALELTKETMERLEQEILTSEEPLLIHTYVFDILLRKGDLESLMLDQDAALTSFEAAEKRLEEEMLPQDPANLTLRSKRILAWGRQASVALINEDTESALELAIKSHELAGELAREYPGIENLQEKWYASFSAVYLGLIQQGETAAAIAKINELIEVITPSTEVEDPNRFYLRILAEGYLNQGLAHAQLFSSSLTDEDLDKAYEACLAAVAALKKSVALFKRMSQIEALQGSAAVQQENANEMLKYMQEVLKSFAETMGEAA